MFIQTMVEVNAQVMKYIHVSSNDNPCYVARNTIATLFQHSWNTLGTLLEYQIRNWKLEDRGVLKKEVPLIEPLILGNIPVLNFATTIYDLRF